MLLVQRHILSACGVSYFSSWTDLSVFIICNLFVICNNLCTTWVGRLNYSSASPEWHHSRNELISQFVITTWNYSVIFISNLSVVLGQAANTTSVLESCCGEQISTQRRNFISSRPEVTITVRFFWDWCLADAEPAHPVVWIGRPSLLSTRFCNIVFLPAFLFSS